MIRLAAVFVFLMLATSASASIGDIGSVGGSTYIVIGVTDIGGGDFVVTLASDKNGVQSVLMEEL